MNSLRARLLLAALPVLLAFVLLTGLALNRADAERAERAAFDRLQGLAYGLLGAAKFTADGGVSIPEDQLPDPRLRQVNSGLYAVLNTSDGTEVWRSPSLMEDMSLPAGPDVGNWRFRRLDNPAVFVLSFGLELEANGAARRYSLNVLQNTGPWYQQRASYRQTLWIWLTAAAVILLGVLVLVLYWGLAPLRKLTSQIGGLRAGQQESISGRYPQELQPLTEALNKLLANERDRLDRYRHALADLAHSLKTPLTVLHTHAGAPREPLERMEQLINYHLQRAAAGAGASFAAPLAIKAVAEQLVAALAKVHQARGIRFAVEAEDAAVLRMERGELMELLGNLLDNAAKWCHTQVRLSATPQNGLLELCIDDDGPGFPDNARELIERGRRADSRPGQGIGLAVVADIVQAQNGELHLERAPLGGARVRLRLSR
ncbi:MAG: ATP-binding protein [Nevskiales bacterium]